MGCRRVISNDDAGARSYVCRVIASMEPTSPILSTLSSPGSSFTMRALAVSLPVGVLPRQLPIALQQHVAAVGVFERDVDLDVIFAEHGDDIAELMELLFSTVLGMPNDVVVGSILSSPIAVFPLFIDDGGDFLHPTQILRAVRPRPFRSLFATSSSLNGMIVTYLGEPVRVDRLLFDMTADHIPGRRRSSLPHRPVAEHFSSEHDGASPFFIDTDQCTTTTLRADVAMHLTAFLHFVPRLKHIVRIVEVLAEVGIDASVGLDLFRRAMQRQMVNPSLCYIRFPNDTALLLKAAPLWATVSLGWTVSVDDDTVASSGMDHLGFERMSFLGNAVLWFVYGSQLVSTMPFTATEGDLSQLRHQLSSQVYLSNLSRRFRLDQLLLSHTPALKMAPRILCGVLYSLFGVLYRLRGVAACRRLLTLFIFADDELGGIAQFWRKSRLPDLVQDIVGARRLLPKDRVALESMCGINWRSPELLSSALTSGLHQQRLEFLGDAVLQIIASDALLDLFPCVDVSQLANLRSSLVRNEHLFAMLHQLGLREYVKISDSRKQKSFADVVEAIIGAMYLDSDLGTCRSFIAAHIIGGNADRIADDLQVLLGPKNLLQEYFHSRGQTHSFPIYSTVAASQSNPIFARPAKRPRGATQFEVQVEFAGRYLASGVGTTVQAAEKVAAQAALDQLDDRWSW